MIYNSLVLRGVYYFFSGKFGSPRKGLVKADGSPTRTNRGTGNLLALSAGGPPGADRIGIDPLNSQPDPGFADSPRDAD